MEQFGLTLKTPDINSIENVTEYSKPIFELIVTFSKIKEFTGKSNTHNF